LRLSARREPARSARGRRFSRHVARRGRTRENSRARHAPGRDLISPRHLPMMFRVLIAVSLLLTVASENARAQLRGHGGPVRALAISSDGTQAVSGSFDTSVLRWSLTANMAEQVRRIQ